MIPILILAAGKSARMGGRDKLLEDVGGVSLLRKQALMALATEEPVFVAVGPENAPREAVLGDLDLTVLTAPDAAEGMGATLRQTVRKLPKTPAFMVVLADLVALETSDLVTVLNACIKNPHRLIWRGATTDGKPGHPIVFADTLRTEFDELAGDHGGEAIVKNARDQTMLVKLPENRARFDLDTPEDWKNWRAANR